MLFFCVPLESGTPVEPVRRAADDGAVEGLNSRVRRCVLLEIASIVEPLRRAAHDGAVEALNSFDAGALRRRLREVETSW